MKRRDTITVEVDEAIVGNEVKLEQLGREMEVKVKDKNKSWDAGYRMNKKLFGNTYIFAYDLVYTEDM